MDFDQRLLALKDTSNDAYLDEVFDLIEGEFLFEKGPTPSEKRKIAADWISTRWLEVRSAVCAKREGFQGLSFEDYVKHFVTITGSVLINHPTLTALAVAHLLAVWCYRNGLNILCQSHADDDADARQG
jgi:hypothetical protein